MITFLLFLIAVALIFGADTAVCIISWIIKLAIFAAIVAAIIAAVMGIISLF
jgi:hypothetical protein